MRGHDLRNFCRDLLAHFRDLLVTKVSGSDELLESAICDRDELQRQSALFSEADLVRFFHSLAETETLLKTAAHPRYQLEIGLVKLMEMRRLEPLGQVMDRLAALEESLRTGKTLPPTKTPAPQGGAGPARSPSSQGSPDARSTSASARSASHASPVAAAGTKTALEVEPRLESAVVHEQQNSEIERIKSALEKRRKMFLVTALEGARHVGLEGNDLCIEFAPDTRHLRDTLARMENVKILREVCQEITNRELGVRFVIREGEAGDAPLSKEETERREQQRLRETAEKDPVVQQILHKFRGEIVDVRPADGEQ
jgi:DNA polymerase III subunit gamma/tau